VPALRLAEIVRILETRYPPQAAEAWDSVGLVTGDPEQEIRKVLLAVDPVAQTVQEALDWGADLLLTHHPLFLRGVTSFAATTAKGRVVHELVRGGCALFNAHTNADAAPGGVSEALARAVGLGESRPVLPHPAAPLDALVTYIPAGQAPALIDALAAAGAGAIGDYTACAWETDGVGQFLPGPGANPTIGAVGEVARVAETRIEMVLPRSRRQGVLEALRAAHPYEEPAFGFVELGSWVSDAGMGRIGDLPAAMSLGAFAQAVADALPGTAGGVRVSGEVDAQVRTVAVCGGSGDSLLDAVRAAGADVYVTADLRHHRASESREDAPGGRPFLVDVAHWASEWLWLPRAAADLGADVEAAGATVETRVSETVTDPWTARFERGAGSPPGRAPAIPADPTLGAQP
jgi:dinuclear metal center YbgI/SA1388 family protein